MSDIAAIAGALKACSEAEVISCVLSVVSFRPDLQQPLVQILSEPLPERHVGVIKKFDPSKQYGFIECPAVFQAFGRDSFLSSVQLGPFKNGSVVSFIVTVKDGKPQAQGLDDASHMAAEVGALVGIQGGHAPPPAVTGGHTPAPVAGKGKAMPQIVSPRHRAAHDAGGWAHDLGGWGSSAPDGKRPRLEHNPQPGPFSAMSLAAQMDPSQRWVGVIKNFFEDKKFGFIECPELHQVYGRDVFLSNIQIGNFGPGSHVSFVVTLSADGKPQAQELLDASHGSNGTFQSMEQLQSNWLDIPPEDWGSLGASDLGNGMLPMGDQGIAADDGSGPRDRNVGVIKKFDAERKYGFIECAQLKASYGYDAFLSDMQIGPFTNGQTVSFAYTLKNGRPQAYDLVAA